MKLEVKVATSTQSAIPELQKEAKTNYYIIIGSDEGVVIINTGETNYTKTKKLLENEEANNNTNKPKTEKK